MQWWPVKGKMHTALSRAVDILTPRIWMLAAILLPVGLIVALWRWLSPATFSERRDFITLIAQILGGGLFLIGLYFTWRRIEVAQEGQITERFTRAIDQLGNEKIEIRLGGIYALERIARDSNRDHWPVMEVLTAYVRERAPWEREGQSGGKEEAKAPIDIQAALTVIGRRQIKGKEAGRLHLDQTDLRCVSLPRAHLQGTNLSGAHLEGAILPNAHLEMAILDKAHLQGAFMQSAHLEYACAIDAHLEGVSLPAARLDGANLWKAHLEKANLAGAHLEKALLLQAHMEGANLSGAHLEGANLRGANLTNALGLTRKQIESAIADQYTRLPDYLG